MPRNKKIKTDVGQTIYQHPDREELITKLVSNVPCIEIAEWLKFKYISIQERKFVLSEKVIQKFRDEYLDFYSIMREDVNKLTKPNIIQELQESIDNNPKYKQVLQKYAESELDLKTIVKQLVALIEVRMEQVFDNIQNDARNIKMDRVLLEYFRAMNEAISTSNEILNGSPDQVNIQNNINIQVLDKHINLVFTIIKEILEQLDYDTSLAFVDKFNERLNALKAEDIPVPIEDRLKEAQILSSTIEKKLTP
jgi:hypothetical protein